MAILASFLAWASKTSDFETSQGNVFRLPTTRSCSPQSERRWLEFASHEGNNLARSQAKLLSNHVKARSIFPSHLNDSVDIRYRQTFIDTRFHGITHPKLQQNYNSVEPLIQLPVNAYLLRWLTKNRNYQNKSAIIVSDRLRLDDPAAAVN